MGKWKMRRRQGGGFLILSLFVCCFPSFSCIAGRQRCIKFLFLFLWNNNIDHVKHADLLLFEMNDVCLCLFSGEKNNETLIPHLLLEPTHVDYLRALPILMFFVNEVTKWNPHTPSNLFYKKLLKNIMTS